GSTIKSITNSGTIKGTNDRDSKGIYIGGNSKIENITNEKGGVITGNGNGIQIDGRGTLQNLNNNGTISGNNGVFLGGGATIENLNNTGTIIGEEHGIRVNNNDQKDTIKTIVNSGFISGGSKDGVALFSVEIEHFDNQKDIIGGEHGLNIQRYNYTSAKVGTLDNSGNIIGTNGHGIYTQTAHNDSITLLNNKSNGLIQGGQDGIHVFAMFGQAGTIVNLNNEGSIVGGNNGINLQEFSKNTAFTNSIYTIENKGTILGQSGAGVFVNGKNQHIKDYIKLDGSDALIAGGTAGIHNKGTIGVNNNNGSLVNSNTGNVIDLQNGATIAAISNDGKNLYTNSSGTAILNEGTIKGNISLDGGSKIIGAIDNKNIITGSIDLKNKSHIDSIINSGTIEKGINLNQSTIGSITNNEGAKTDLDLSNNS
ncbi:hypothetical protein L8T90_07815, partial [Campylobacter sp. RKI_CA19_01121]|nr:hypothetical protein [Campylobacter sp. RKI_CA19_01121]